MASAQWKNFQPSNQDGAMSAYQRSSSFSKQSNNSNHVSSSSNSSGPLRETGIIEKLLHSYGFIQCCEKQARLFFHFSQFCGNIDYLKVGDAVEFETTYDRKTGKPIAREVVKISPESLSDEVLSEERVSGLVTTEIKNGNEGRIAYENRGECFFLPYSNDDVDPNICGEDVHFQSGDKVTFLISPDKQTGNPRARNVRLERPIPEKYQGCINSLKETFGFIERADVVKEIFFHASECNDFKNLNLGDDVAFNVQTRNNKEVATNVVCLPTGTVVFEDISSEAVMGQVVKSIDRFQSRQVNNELPGRIRYRRDNNRENEIQFGEKDTKGDFTLQNGDWVQFNMAVDRRDKLQRATNIELLDESFIVSGEKREQGVIAAIKDTYGFITYGPLSQTKRNNRGDSNRVFFRFSELLDPEHDPKLSDEVEFTIAQVDPASPNRYHATRIRNLPPGTIVSEPVSYNSSNHDDRSFGTPKKIVGKVEKKPNKSGKNKQRKNSNFNQGSNSEEDENSQQDEYLNGFSSDGYDGIISYNSNGETLNVAYSRKDYDKKNKPRVGDKVEFLIETLNNQDYARDIRLLGPHAVRNGFRFTNRGFVAALKDSFGFIETEDHDREIFFHFNVFDGNPSQLDLGQEVEYGISNKGVKISAEAVRKIQQGTIPQPEIKAELLNGVITRPVRCFNPEQDEYAGLVTLTLDALPDLPEELPNGDDNHSMSRNFMDRPVYEFGITSLEDKHDFLQKGDAVQFQIGAYKIDGELKERAVNIKAIRSKLQANVEAIHGNFGFLSYEVEDGKKLFFHMSEVKNGDILQTGDRVEFVLMHNQRTGKHSACSVVKIGDVQPTQRPERLLNRLRTVSLDEGPKVIVIRQPKGPEGSGFKNQRNNSVISIHASSNGISASNKNHEILVNGKEHVNSGLNVEAPIFGMNHCDPNNSFDFECQHNQQISA